MKVSFLLALALLFSRLAAAAYEQRCYYDAGRLAPNYILPCYMEGFGLPAYSCCKQGSNCLKQGACWDAITKVTYQYGCTDSTYQDDKCPKKCGLDREKSQWVGMVFCDGINNTPNNTWLCHHPDNCGNKGHCADHIPWAPELFRPDEVICKDLKLQYIAIDSEQNIGSIGELPRDESGISSYLSAHPTTSTISSSRPTLPITDAIDTTSTAPTTPPTTTSKLQRDKSTAIGIGAGVPLAVVVVGALVYFFHRRHRAKAARAREKEIHGSDHSSQPGYAFKAELPGRDRQAFEVESSLSPSYAESSTIGQSSPMHSQRSPHSQYGSLMSPLSSEFSEKTGQHQPNDDSVASEIHGNEIYELPA